jgi:hypothetical protein
MRRQSGFSEVLAGGNWCRGSIVEAGGLVSIRIFLQPWI